MISFKLTVKHFVNLFYRRPATPNKDPPNTHLTSQLHRRLHFRRNRCSAEEVRIIDTQSIPSRKITIKVLNGCMQPNFSKVASLGIQSRPAPLSRCLLEHQGRMTISQPETLAAGNLERHQTARAAPQASVV